MLNFCIQRPPFSDLLMEGALACRNGRRFISVFISGSSVGRLAAVMWPGGVFCAPTPVFGNGVALIPVGYFSLIPNSSVTRLHPMSEKEEVEREMGLSGVHGYV